MYPNLFHLPEWFPVLGGSPITSFGVMMLAAFLVGGYVLKTGMVRQGRTADQAWDLLFWAVIGGIVGSRLYYVLLNYDRLSADPLGMIFSRGGMVWYGGFLLAAALVFRRIHKVGLPMGRTVDAAAPGLAIAYAVGRVGCFLVGDDYGRPTDSWVGIAFPDGKPPSTATNLSTQFGVEIDPAMVEKYGEVLPVHPTQLYEVGISTLIFVVLWRLRDHRNRPGWLLALWVVLASAERFLVEIFRAKDDRFFGLFTLAQVISIILAAVGVAWMMKLRGAKAVRG
ncbi:MAG: prolipoprotein diacylglyceryl transferase [Gemmatimonadetes bacterium]|nr:prolipoprotein diacylglyceryl transferase [Gemmatimonadota bacterium]